MVSLSDGLQKLFMDKEEISVHTRAQHQVHALCRLDLSPFCDMQIMAPTRPAKGSGDPDGVKILRAAIGDNVIVNSLFGDD